FLSLGETHVAVGGDHAHIGVAHAEGDGVAVGILIIELAAGGLLAPGQLGDFAAAGKIALAAAGQVHGDVAQIVAGVAAGGLDNDYVGDLYLLLGVAVYVGRAVLLYTVLTGVLIVDKT